MWTMPRVEIEDFLWYKVLLFVRLVAGPPGGDVTQGESWMVSMKSGRKCGFYFLFSSVDVGCSSEEIWLVPLSWVLAAADEIHARFPFSVHVLAVFAGLESHTGCLSLAPLFWTRRLSTATPSSGRKETRCVERVETAVGGIRYHGTSLDRSIIKARLR